MNFIKDIKFMAKNTVQLFKMRPSHVSKREREQAIYQKGFARGTDHGLRQLKMYAPGAERGILQGDWSTTINSATSIIRSDFKTLCARSEQAYRISSIARRAINILTQYIVGQGNRPYPSVCYADGTPVDGINNQLSSDWERANDQIIRNGTQELTYYQAQALKFITMAVYGSVLTNTVSSKKGSLLPFAFQILKPYRLDFSKDTMYGGNYEEMPDKLIVHGIEMNEYAEPIKFHFENNRSYSSDNMSIAFYPLETEQYLGLPWLTPVLPQIWDHQQLFDDKMKQSRIGAKLGVKISQSDAGGISKLLQKDSSGNEYFDLDFQGFYMGKDKPEPISFTDPISDTFDPIVRMIMQYVAIGMGFSYQLFTSDLSGANFSSARMNKITDNTYFRTLYKWFVKAECQRTWEKFVYWEVMTGRLSKFGIGLSEYQKDPWKYNQCFHLPMDGEDWVDPLKDVQATVLAYKLGQITLQEICARSGKHWKAVLRQLAKERETLKEMNMEYLLPENVNNIAPEPNGEPVEQNSNANNGENVNENT
jgi:lambda family phage portal protein